MFDSYLMGICTMVIVLSFVRLTFDRKHMNESERMLAVIGLTGGFIGFILFGILIKIAQ